MEKALLKIARQINAFDEASLMSLWEKYADRVSHFEPTKRWEEAVIVLNIIQSTRMKNQLFNYNWARSRMPDEGPVEVDLAALTAPEPSALRDKGRGQDAENDEATSGQSDGNKGRKGKILTLTPKNK
ncbi:MAG: hypothetical protein CL942_09465 [Desulfovibrio sp.]|nr:hypothetical protein [Desulfovibrio sp.]|tara:strand:- start:35209 stop:35592 length:384 start_codon:yes stop_codon:yes gene_type:complete